MLLKCGNIVIEIKEASNENFNLIIGQMTKGRLEK
jgi:hypothetical protein